MTGRIGSLTADSTISATDAARIAAEEELHTQWERRAARVVAAGSHDLDDCRLLLDILGLDADVLIEARTERSTARPSASAVAAAAGQPTSRETGKTRKRNAHAA